MTTSHISLPIVIAGFDNILPVIIIFAVILTQIIKAIKKASRSVQSDQQEPETYTAPENELQKFLRSLTGEPEPPVPPAQHPEPPRPSVQAPRPPSVQARPAPVVRQVPPTPPPVLRKPPPPPLSVAAQAPPEAPPRRAPSEAPVQVDAYSLRRTGTPSMVQKIRRGLGSDLIDRNSLRKAIVLREILGPPIGLR